MSERPVRVVVADDHPIFRSALCRLLETESSCKVVAEAEDGLQAVDAVARTDPDLLLLDFSMPRADGLDALREINRRGLRPRVVVLTAEIEPRQVVQALKLGAAGVLLKSAATELLFKCIKAVTDGQYWVGRGTTADLVSALQRYDTGQAGSESSPPALTTREQQVIAGLLRGESNKAIARRLGIAEQTVKNHLSQLYQKLGVASRLELVLYAREHGEFEAAQPRR